MTPLEKAVNNVGTRNELDRHEWIKQQLKAIPAGARLLDAGAGEQQYRPDCEHLTYVAQDFAQAARPCVPDRRIH